ncbi:hypothetical protein ID866_2475 [Astraeus odoratus]|nr:hypothetical protein ID866_2475 [Astraeus odoratus]
MNSLVDAVPHPLNKRRNERPKNGSLYGRGTYIVLGRSTQTAIPKYDNPEPSSRSLLRYYLYSCTFFEVT